MTDPPCEVSLWKITAGFTTFRPFVSLSSPLMLELPDFRDKVCSGFCKVVFGQNPPLQQTIEGRGLVRLLFLLLGRRQDLVELE